MASTQQKRLDIEKVLELFQPGGRLSLCIKGFEPRPQQQQMLSQIVEAYENQGIALIEAGTGTGKSMAYLIPAMLWAIVNQERTLISTHTIHLQEQLIHKDIPILVKGLGLECKAVLVKGMNQYVCLRKVQDVQDELPLFQESEQKELQNIAAWTRYAKEGSRSELGFQPSGATWDKVNAEADTCNSTECPHFQQCFFFKARRQAQDAQILVANHHLMFADIACRAESDNYSSVAILPPYQHVVVDEAHHIEDVATQFFASQVSRFDLMRALARLASEKQGNSHGKLPLLRKKLSQFFGKEVSRDVGGMVSRLNIDLPGLRREVLHQLNLTFDLLNGFLRKEEESSSDSLKLRLLPEQFAEARWKEEVTKSVQTFTDASKRYIQAIFGIIKDVQAVKNASFEEQVAGVCLDIQAFANRLEKQCLMLESFICGTPTNERVRWMETERVKTFQNLHLIDAELYVGEQLVQAFFNRFRTLILCSATLTTNQQFDFIRHRLGLSSSQLTKRDLSEHIFDSPFKYSEQALLVVPTDVPLPTDPHFQEVVIQSIWNAIEASGGQAFVLFTSYSMLQACYKELKQKMEDNRYVLLKQGDEQRHALLERFKTTPRSVLFGTDSFWEGVDVAGDALRCVVIVKLPFKVPTEPLIQARMEALVAEGKDPFYDYSIPQAIVKFKQGFGRLIRHQKDRGCIVCLDARLIRKGYGKLFLNSLPPCKQVFETSQKSWQLMRDFYRRTASLVKGIGA